MSDSSSAARMCGARALVHLFQLRGRNHLLRDVWNSVRAPDPFGGYAARLSRLAGFARRQGYAAHALQSPPLRGWEALSRCWQNELSVILNHRAPWDHREGHFSLLCAIDRQRLATFDPTTNRSVSYQRGELMELWQPNRESIGHAFVVIGNELDPAPPHDDFPCPRCHHRLSLTPAWLFAREHWSQQPLFRRFFCDFCDAAYTGSSRSQQPSSSATQLHASSLNSER